MVAGTLSLITGLPGSDRQAILPTSLKVAYTGDDVLGHDVVFAGQGKGHLTIAIDNAPNKGLTWALYGMHASTETVGDVGAFPIATAQAIAQAAKGYEVCADAFPWYLLRVTQDDTPTDNPLKSVTVYVNLVQG